MATARSYPLPRSLDRGSGSPPKVGMFSAEWCAGPQINLGGSDYWRLALPAAKLYENGWDIIFARNLAEGPDGRLAIQNTNGEWLLDRDVVIIQRWMGEGTAERILRAREAGQVVINEVDDDYWNFPEAHAAIRATDPKLNAATNSAHYRESIAASSLITVSTPYLARLMADWGPPVKVVRNYIDCDFWPLQPPGDFVGWVGGLPWRGNDLQLLSETVVPWLRERNQFFYHGGDVSHMGPGPSAEEKLGYERVTTRPLTSLFDYPRLWDPLRVVLIPMEDSLFNRAKSACKALEACARGVPFIASDQEEYRALGFGRIVHEPEDWVRHLEELEDPQVYAAEVVANRKRAVELDIAKRWGEWSDVLLAAIA